MIFAPPPQPDIAVRPSVVEYGDTIKVAGTDWIVFESCAREVKLTIKSDQNAFGVGTARVTRKGRFSFRYDVRRSEIGRGDWRFQAKQRCESGKDGSPDPIRRAAEFTIR